jgi:hypothetical protein
MTIRRDFAQMKRLYTSKNKNWGSWAGAAVILLVLLAAWTWRAPNKLVPTELVGEWHTSDPNYADRTFELDPVCISFTTGDGTVSVGFIKEVKEVPEGSRILYTISYTVDDEPNEVSFYYDLKNDKTIWFKNQKSIAWRKDQDS